MNSQCKVVYDSDRDNKETRVKIVWFGFGVSERESKLKTTLHGEPIVNGWQKSSAITSVYVDK